jgi:hypothetical protein
MMGVANLAVAALVVTASLVTEAVVAQSTADILNQLQANGVNITLLNSTSTTTARSQNGCSLLVSPINFAFSLLSFIVQELLAGRKRPPCPKGF